MGSLIKQKDSKDSQIKGIYERAINYNVFKKNPNIKYQLTITKDCDPSAYTHLFEVYISLKDDQTYIATKNKNYDIDIYHLFENKKILSLKGHECEINNVRYFFSKKDYNEYLISSDAFSFDHKVIIWDITDNYSIKYKINTQYNAGIIFSCLLAFPYGREVDFIITSTSNVNTYYKEYSSTKKYSLNDGKFIQNIEGSDNYPVYYLLSWYKE